MRVLVLGGIRSGKSRWAETSIADTAGPDTPVRYLATGAPVDDDSWADRVSAHRAARPSHWSTVESTDVAALLRDSPGTPTLVDDVGGWLTAVLDRDGWTGDVADRVADEVEELITAVRGFGSPLVMVSPEVGLTVVPATTAGRTFTDQLGLLNQRLADLCDRVVLVVAGQPLGIKGSPA